MSSATSVRANPTSSPGPTTVDRLTTLAGVVEPGTRLAGACHRERRDHDRVPGDDVGCTGHWPAAVQGKPTMYASGARAGDDIWHDAAGWHLRVTKVTSARAVFAGWIRSDKPMAVAGAALEGDDRFTLSADKLTLTYRFVNRGHVDGLDFRTACAERLGLAGSMDGDEAPDRQDLDRLERPSPAAEPVRHRPGPLTRGSGSSASRQTTSGPACHRPARGGWLVARRRVRAYGRSVPDQTCQASSDFATRLRIM